MEAYCTVCRSIMKFARTRTRMHVVLLYVIMSHFSLFVLSLCLSYHYSLLIVSIHKLWIHPRRKCCQPMTSWFLVCTYGSFQSNVAPYLDLCIYLYSLPSPHIKHVPARLWPVVQCQCPRCTITYWKSCHKCGWHRSVVRWCLIYDAYSSLFPVLVIWACPGSCCWIFEMFQFSIAS